MKNAGLLLIADHVGRHTHQCAIVLVVTRYVCQPASCT